MSVIRIGVDEIKRLFMSSTPKDIVWNVDSHVNSFVDAGLYSISGQRLNSADGLPIMNAAPGHTIAARLLVLDSSINSSEVCVTQLLILSNRLGGDGNIYIRTGNAASRESLSHSNSIQWGAWGRMQTNVEVGQVSSLDSLIDNGMYSGIYLHNGTMETFVLVVLNNYVAAGAINATRSVAQFKYSLAMDGTITFTKRVGGGPGAWGLWKDINAPLYGDNSGRPDKVPIGTCYFDTSLNKPLWWNGTAWVDAQGQQY